MAEEGFQGLDRAIRRITRLKTNTRHTEQPMRAIGALVLGSVEKNFREQGRPQKWPGLASGGATGARKRDAKGRFIGGSRRKGRGRGGRGRKILIDTARLKNSIGFRLVATPGIQWGTKVVYARRHHFGYPGGKGRGRLKTPARPFLMFQKEDFPEIEKIFKRHIGKS